MQAALLAALASLGAELPPAATGDELAKAEKTVQETKT